MKKEKIKIISCAVVSEELRPLLPEGTDFEKMDFGLHQSPDKLHQELQRKIDESGAYDYIVLGYGLCGMATVGLHSDTATLVIPKADDCISVFLGSRDAYVKQQQNNPGSYFLTRGWIDGWQGGEIDEIVPTTDIMQRLAEKYGVEKARRIYSVYQSKEPLQNYKRMVFISTSDNPEIEEYKNKARERAETLKLRYEEIRGTDEFLRKLAKAEWDENFVIVPPGRPVSFDDFKS